MCIKKAPAPRNCDAGFDYEALGLAAVYSSTRQIQPLGASMRPIWMPVRVSYSLRVTGPMFPSLVSKVYSFAPSTTLPTGEMTAAVPHRPH